MAELRIRLDDAEKPCGQQSAADHDVSRRETLAEQSLALAQVFGQQREGGTGPLPSILDQLCVLVGIVPVGVF